MPVLAVYAHLPWCVRKCPYCDFNSHPAPRGIAEDTYVDALLADLRHDLPRVAGRQVESVFIGGGTPSLFSAAAIGRLLAALRVALDFAPDAEVTLEANPGTVERGCFEDYAAAGVNRVSLGAQTFDARYLEALGRIHSPADIDRSVRELERAAITNFNLDLMYGLPAQPVADAVADVRSAIALSPAHVSLYQLTLEPGTPFFRAPPPLPDEDTVADMQRAGHGLLEAAGFGRYEVAAYARVGRRCRHNLAYWTFGDYLGLGAGAHGKLTTDEGVLRTERVRDPRRYLAAVAAGTAVTLRRVAPEDLPFEFMLNALRLADGFQLDHFTAATGLPVETILPILTTLADRKLLNITDRRVKPTATGFDFLTDLQAAFLPDRRATPAARPGNRVGPGWGAVA